MYCWEITLLERSAELSRERSFLAYQIGTLRLHFVFKLINE